MATGYILWDKVNKALAGGPYPTNQAATDELRGKSLHVPRKDKGDPIDPLNAITVETVTV